MIKKWKKHFAVYLAILTFIFSFNISYADIIPDENSIIAEDSINDVKNEENLSADDIYARTEVNGDGSKTAYFYKYPVKYVDIDGDIRDVDTSIRNIVSKDGWTYASDKNSFELLYDESGRAKIKISDKEVIIEPEYCNYTSETFCQIEGNEINYYNLYEENTILRYTSASFGVEQEIVITSNNASPSYVFLISGTDIDIVNQDTGYKIVFPDEKYVNISNVVVYDSSGHFSEGNVKIEKLKESNEYKMVFSLDPSFLRESEISFPVVLDPTFVVSSANSSGYISDTTIYSGKPSLNTGTWIYNHVGYADASYKIGRMLISFPGLCTNSLYLSLSGAQITDAKLNIYEATGTAAQTVDLYKYTGTSWNENTATWNNVSPSSFSTLLDSASPAYGSLAQFNILTLVKQWKDGIADQDKGVLLKNTNEDNSAKFKGFCSAESATDNPFISITYTDVSNPAEAGKTYLIRNKSSGQYLYRTSSGALSLSSYTGADSQKWQLQDLNNGTVRVVNMADAGTAYGDHTFVLYSYSTVPSIRYGTSNPEMLAEQCWILDGADISSVRIISKKYSSEMIAVSPYISSAIFSTYDDTYSRWSFVECGNTYSVPSIVSGAYDTAKFNTTGASGLRGRMNCYSYAVGFYTNTLSYLQPGALSSNSFNIYEYEENTITGKKISDEGIRLWGDYILNSLDADINILKGTTGEVYHYPSSSDEKIVGPWRKVALVLDVTYNYGDFYDYDYHWYVESDDGYWSHKRGLNNAVTIDAANALISDPALCNREYTNGLNYSVFVGWYKIRANNVLTYADRQSSDYYLWDNAGDVVENENTVYPVETSPYQIMGCIEYADSTSSLITNGNDLVNTMSWAADVDWYGVMVQTSGYYRIFSQIPQGSLVDPCAAVYDKETFLFFNNDFSASDQNFSMYVYLTPGVLYTIRVSGFSESSHGNYLLYIQKIT